MGNRYASQTSMHAIPGGIYEIQVVDLSATDQPDSLFVVRVGSDTSGKVTFFFDRVAQIEAFARSILKQTAEL